MKNYGVWEGHTSEKFVKDYILWEGPHTAAGQECEGGRVGERTGYELMATPIQYTTRVEVVQK